MNPANATRLRALRDELTERAVRTGLSDRAKRDVLDASATLDRVLGYEPVDTPAAAHVTLEGWQ